MARVDSGINCPYCQKETKELHQVRSFLVRDLPAFGQPVYLKVPRRQFYCRYCQKYITEELDYIDPKRKETFWISGKHLSESSQIKYRASESRRKSDL